MARREVDPAGELAVKNRERKTGSRDIPVGQEDAKLIQRQDPRRLVGEGLGEETGIVTDGNFSIAQALFPQIIGDRLNHEGQPVEGKFPRQKGPPSGGSESNRQEENSLIIEVVLKCCLVVRQLEA